GFHTVSSFEILIPFVGRRYEQRAAELSLADLANHRLSFGRNQPVREGLAGRYVHFRKLRRIHRHDVVDVVEGWVVLDEDRQTNALRLGHIGAAVRVGVSLKLRGNVHGEALALSGLAIPSLTLWIDAGPSPDCKLTYVGAGLIPARYERGLCFGNTLQCLDG